MNIVTLAIGGEVNRYVVDVGFGGDGPTKPLSLTDGCVARNPGTQQVTLRLENIDSNADPGQRLWGYKIRNDQADF